MREPFQEFMASELKDGTLLITCGLPATWKTETTDEILKIKIYKRLRTDIIRLEVLKNEDIFNEKVAANMNKRMLVYDEMFRQAEELLGKEPGVILDATFVKQDLRKRAAGIAAKTNKTFVILETKCPQEVSIRRILRRTKDNYESNALTEQAYLNNKNKFQKIDIDNLKATYPHLAIVHLTVDTTKDLPGEWYVIGKETR